jgi:hypothetical protein
MRATPGERVVTAEQQAWLERAGGGDVHVHLHGTPLITKRELEDFVGALAAAGIARRIHIRQRR